MRKLVGLCRALESIPGLLALPAVWKSECGQDFDLLQEYLRPTEFLGSNFPCPHPGAGYCPRKIIDHGAGEYVAICRDVPKLCLDVPLTAKEALIHELDLSAFLKPILNAGYVRAEAPKVRSHGVWSVGLSNRRSSLNQPVFLVISPSRGEFESAVGKLLLDVTGQFVIMAPSSRYRSVYVQERLQARGTEYLCLEEQIFLDDADRFSTIDAMDSADIFQPTSAIERKRVVAAFRSKNMCKVVDIQSAAGVDESDYYKWLNGKIPDHYSTCMRIERLLYSGLPRRFKRATLP